LQQCAVLSCGQGAGSGSARPKHRSVGAVGQPRKTKEAPTTITWDAGLWEIAEEDVGLGVRTGQANVSDRKAFNSLPKSRA